MMVQSLKRTLGFINNHEFASRHRLKACFQFLAWQLRSRALPENKFGFPFVNDSRFSAKKGMTGATGNIYTGLHDFAEMGFLLHFLRKKDCFFDVGANVGIYTILASKAVGCRSIAFEPDEQTFSYLKDNISTNKMGDLVVAVQKGVGAEKGFIRFTVNGDTTNHVIQSAEHSGLLQTIEVVTLDDFADNHPTLIKIDVEGYESQVIAGGEKLFQDENLKAVIIELNGSGGRYGFDEKDVHRKFLAWGFKPYSYEPWKRVLTEQPAAGDWNTIYIRDVHTVSERLATAQKFVIWNDTV